MTLKTFHFWQTERHHFLESTPAPSFGASRKARETATH